MKKSVKRKEAFLVPQKYKQNHGKHEEDLLLYLCEEICQAQGGFSCPQI